MPLRLMRHTQGSFGPLDKNASHQFAVNHAVSLYARNTVFSFIPKNGCTSLRYSAALENQVIDGPDKIGWIHSNNVSFRPAFGELVTASYTFVVLRCPFHRLVSCFLHRIVDRPSYAQPLQMRALADRLRLSGPIEKRVAKLLQRASTTHPTSQDAITFADFVTLLETPGALELDAHWRPQVDFLVYHTYDDIFRLEDMDSFAATVQAKSGFVVHDTRTVTKHGNWGRERINDGFFGRTDVRTLREMKSAMKVPDYRRLYDTDLYQRVGRLYQADVELYAREFGQSALLQLQ